MKQKIILQTVVRIIQNLVAITLMFVGTLVLDGLLAVDYAPALGQGLLSAGIIISICLIVVRTLSNKSSKKFSLIAKFAILSWVGLLISVLLLIFYPKVYGFDLEILVNWGLPALCLYLAGFIMTSIELFRTVRPSAYKKESM